MKPNLYTPIKAAITTALINFIAISCSCNYTKINNRNLKGLQLFVNYPIVFPDESKAILFNTMDTLYIYYLNDYTLYCLPPSRKFSSNGKIYGTEPYFFYKNKAPYGILFHSINDTSNGIKLKVDSFLTARAFFTARFNIGLNDSLAQRISNNNNIVEKYKSKTKLDESIFDSSYYYYNINFNNINYTFSENLDSIKGMKLYKVRLLYNEEYSPTYKTIMPKREYFFEIKPLSIRNPREIVALFERFKKNIQ